MDRLAASLRGFDAYPKTLDDVRVRTMSGAIVSLIGCALIIYLFVEELSNFRTIKTESNMYVDMSIGEKLSINFDVTFPVFPCEALHLDAMDISGYQQLELDHNIFKQRLDPGGQPHREKVQIAVGEDGALSDALNNATFDCGSCYGAGDEGQCCNTCDDVRNAYRKKGWSFEQANSQGAGIVQCVHDNYIENLNEQAEGKEGCNLHGSIEVQKVAGNFHFGVGRNFHQASMHVHDLMPLRNININLTHTVNHLSFGTDYPGMKNPLDKWKQVQAVPTCMYQYFLKVVPTLYEYVTGDKDKVESNQYSVTDYKRELEGGWDERGKLPGVFFFYDVSPIMVHYSEKTMPFYHFMTEVCAIIGGAITMTGFIDSFIYRTDQAVRKKMQLGKLG